MAIRGSAAWVLTIVSVVAFIVGALLLTVLDPVMQTLFGSALFTGSTSYSQDFLTWAQNSWAYWSVFILIGIGSLVWVTTRRAG